MSTSRSDLLALLDVASHDPTRIQRVQVAQVEGTYDGTLTLMNATSPFAQALEMSAVIGANNLLQSKILSRRQYPALAQDYDDLYYHMSDADYLDRFGTPSQTSMLIFLSRDEIVSKAVYVGNTTTRKLQIPRHSNIVVDGIPFTMQYPIDIFVMAHGGLQIIYNAEQESPIQPLTSNQVDWEYLTLTDSQVEMVKITVPILQMRLKSYTASLNAARAFKQLYTLTDQFYYCRAYMLVSGQWTEIKTTHSQQVFDPLDPTLQLKVLDEGLQVAVPPVYFTSGAIAADLRIDIYTIQGPMDKPLSSFTTGDFIGTWLDYDESDSGLYSAPMSQMTTVSILSTDSVTGGANAVSFEELRSRVMSNALGAVQIPMSNAQMGTTLEDLGFDAAVEIDDLTNRIYVASRKMPVDSSGQTVTGCDATTMTLTTTLATLAALPTAVDNGELVTLLPTTLYQGSNGLLSIVSDSDQTTLNNLTSDSKATAVTAGGYLVTPFHYVFDISDDGFAVRPYYLDNPKISQISFVNNNSSLGLVVRSSNTRSLVRTSTGWKLTILTSSDDAFKALTDEQIQVQLAFTPNGQDIFGLVNGVQTLTTEDGERVFEFDLKTNWSVDADHLLSLTNFYLHEAIDRVLKTTLTTDFHLIFTVNDYQIDGQVTSDIDTVMGSFLLKSGAIGLYQERIRLQLGINLDGLWTRARSVIGTESYKTYENDVPETYQEDIYKYDGKQIVIEQDDSGQITFVKLHSKGDAVLDADGNPVYLHRAGDLILDENNKPIVVTTRATQRQVDMCLFDGVYRFATTEVDTTYFKSIPDSIATWITSTLSPVKKKLHENTRLLFKPRSTIGLISALIDDSVSKNIEAAQNLVITFYVSKAVYNDTDIRAALTSKAIECVASEFGADVITTFGLEEAIMDNVGVDALAVKVQGLGGDAADYQIISLANTTSRLCIDKALVAQADGTFAVTDGIKVAFKKHAAA